MHAAWIDPKVSFTKLIIFINKCIELQRQKDSFSTFIITRLANSCIKLKTVITDQATACLKCTFCSTQRLSHECSWSYNGYSTDRQNQLKMASHSFVVNTSPRTMRPFPSIPGSLSGSPTPSPSSWSNLRCSCQSAQSTTISKQQQTDSIED